MQGVSNTIHLTPNTIRCSFDVWPHAGAMGRKADWNQFIGKGGELRFWCFGCPYLLMRVSKNIFGLTQNISRMPIYCGTPLVAMSCAHGPGPIP